MTDSVRHNIELVNAAYTAFGAGDVEAFRSLYADDVVHTLPGTSRVSGAHRGLPAVLAFYGRLAELSAGTVSVEPETFFSDGDDRILAIHHTTATRDGRQLDIREGIVITISNGKITALDGFQADLDEYEAFWR